MKKPIILGMIVAVIASLTVFYLLSLPQQPSPSVEQKEEKVVQQEEEQIVQPSSEAEGPPSSPAYVLVFPNQLEYQLSPQKRYAERTKADAEDRFKRLAQREQRIAKPVNRGEPLIINLQNVMPAVPQSENSVQ